MSSRTAEWVVRGGLVVTIVATGLFARQVQNLTDCVAAYNDANNERSVVLTEATNDERAAERKADDAQAALFLSPIVSIPTAHRTTLQHAAMLLLLPVHQLPLYAPAKAQIASDASRRTHTNPNRTQNMNN